MSDARGHILKRLRDHPVLTQPTRAPAPPRGNSNLEQRIATFTERMSAAHGEVHRVPRTHWVNWLTVQLLQRGLQQVLVGTGEIGRQLGAVEIRRIELHHYDRDIEHWKPGLFSGIDVAITGTRCGIAETGSLVLWPDRDEPRLMSLVPPVHIALLDAERLHQSFAAAIEAENWATQMPTNALLISGPSKTADIEQTLAYGIHGPQQLITLILE